MIEIKKLSQRDPRWSNQQHGTSVKKIGETGCTITCLSSVLSYLGFDTDPLGLNSLLTKGKGYANGNLVIWSRVGELTKTKFVKRTNPYNNLEVAFNIYVKKNPVLVEVVAPKGVPGGKHWVVFVGDKLAMDPWTGTLKNTSSYVTLGYAIFNKK